MTEPLTDAQRDQLRQSLATGPRQVDTLQLWETVPALLAEIDRLRDAALCGCGDEHTAESLCPNCQASDDVHPTADAIDRIVLHQRDALLADVERLRAENKRQRQALDHLIETVRDTADGIAALTDPAAHLAARTLRTACDRAERDA